MTFTTSKIMEFQVKLNALLQEFANENELVAGDVIIKYSPDDFQIKAQFNSVENNPDKIDPRFLRDLQRNGELYGLTEKMIGLEIIVVDKTRQVTCKFSGMRSSKAVLHDVTSGKIYLLGAAFVAHQIKLQHGAR